MIPWNNTKKLCQTNASYTLHCISIIGPKLKMYLCNCSCITGYRAVFWHLHMSQPAMVLALSWKCTHQKNSIFKKIPWQRIWVHPLEVPFAEVQNLTAHEVGFTPPIYIKFARESNKKCLAYPTWNQFGQRGKWFFFSINGQNQSSKHFSK